MKKDFQVPSKRFEVLQVCEPEDVLESLEYCPAVSPEIDSKLLHWVAVTAFFVLAVILLFYSYAIHGLVK
jgi:hypothetical protein